MWLLTLLSTAHGAACCVGATSALPTQVGECERVVVAAGLGAEVSTGAWDRQGRLTAPSVQERALVPRLGLGVRLHRTTQVSVAMPVVLNQRANDLALHTGAGVGDLRLSAQVDPFEEGMNGAPVPVFTAGLRAPTGRDWTAATDALGADVTGVEGAAATLGLRLERTMGDTPWAVGTLVDAGVAHPVHDWTVFGTLGRYVAPQWTVVGTAQHVTRFASGGRSRRSSLGARVIHGRPVAWRAWAGVDADVPAPGLGRSMVQGIRGSVGAAWVR